MLCIGSGHQHEPHSRNPQKSLGTGGGERWLSRPPKTPVDAHDAGRPEVQVPQQKAEVKVWLPTSLEAARSAEGQQRRQDPQLMLMMLAVRPDEYPRAPRFDAHDSHYFETKDSNHRICKTLNNQGICSVSTCFHVFSQRLWSQGPEFTNTNLWVRRRGKASKQILMMRTRGSAYLAQKMKRDSRAQQRFAVPGQGWRWVNTSKGGEKGSRGVGGHVFCSVTISDQDCFVHSGLWRAG